MTYETYQIPEKHLKSLQRQKAAKLTKQYVKEHGIEPPANVKAGFMDISEEEYLRYRDVFFAVDFAKGMPTEGAIVNVPWERPNTRYNEYFQCVYNVVDTQNRTQLFGDTAAMSGITYIEIDGKEVPLSDIKNAGYVFETLGTHRVDFLQTGSYKIAPANFRNCYQLREVTIPEIVQMTQSGVGNFCFQNCTGLCKITCLPKTPPDIHLGTAKNGNDVYGIKPSGTLYVPKGCKEAYENKWIRQPDNTTVSNNDWVTVLGSGWEVVEMDD